MTSLLTIITVTPFEGPCSSSPPGGEPDLRSDEVRPCYPVCSLLLPRSLQSIGCTACAATQNKIYIDSSISRRSLREITKMWLLQRALSLQAHPVLGSKHMPGSSSRLLIHRDEFVSVMLFPSCYVWSRGTGLGKTSRQVTSSLTNNQPPSCSAQADRLQLPPPKFPDSAKKKVLSYSQCLCNFLLQERQLAIITKGFPRSFYSTFL